MDRKDASSQPVKGRALRRFGWLVLIWACSVGVLSLVALGMRLVMGFAGMTR